MTWSNQVSASMHVPQEWEYTIAVGQVPQQLIDKLNELGKQGWELVSVRFPAPSRDGFSNPVGTHSAFLKRPKPHAVDLQ